MTWELGTWNKLKAWSLKLENGRWKPKSFKIGFGWRGFGLQAADRWPRLTAGLMGFHLAADRGDADGSWLTAGRDFTWQQQIVISSAVGSNRSRLVVAGWWLQTCGLRLPCSVVKLFVFVFSCLDLWVVSCGRQRVCVCVRFASDCAACVRAVQLVCVLFCHCVVCVCCLLCKCVVSSVCSVCCASVLCHLCAVCAVCAAQQQRMCVWLCAAVRAACDKVKLCHLCVCVGQQPRPRVCGCVQCSWLLVSLFLYKFISS